MWYGTPFQKEETLRRNRLVWGGRASAHGLIKIDKGEGEGCRSTGKNEEKRQAIWTKLNLKYGLPQPFCSSCKVF